MSFKLIGRGYFNPRLGIETSEVEKSKVKKFMVEKSGVEAWG